MKILWFLFLIGPYIWAKAEEQAFPELKLDDLQQLLPDDLGEEEPTVVVALMVRNKAHVLPLFLTYLEQQDYPRKRISLW